MGYGTIVLDPDPRPRPGRSPTSTSWRRTTMPAALDRLAARVRGRHDRVREPAGRGARAPRRRRGRSPHRRPPSRSRRTAWPRSGFLRERGVPTAPWSTGDAVGYPAIVKTARLGYDGKGQVAVDDDADLAAALAELARAVRRRAAGAARRRAERASSPAPPTVATSRTPSPRTTTSTASSTSRSCRPASIRRIATEAQALAVRIAEALDYVGVLAVELFVSAGRLLVNELAPRPHNSGHWTLDAAVDEPVRAAGPGSVRPRPRCDGPRRAPAVAMVNLLGDRWAGGEPDWARGARRPGRPPAPLRQARRPSRPQDGPPHRDRRLTRRRRGRRGARARPPHTLTPTSVADRVRHAARHDRRSTSGAAPTARSAGRPSGRSPRRRTPRRRHRSRPRPASARSPTSGTATGSRAAGRRRGTRRSRRRRPATATPAGPGSTPSSARACTASATSGRRITSRAARRGVVGRHPVGPVHLGQLVGLGRSGCGRARAARSPAPARSARSAPTR